MTDYIHMYDFVGKQFPAKIQKQKYLDEVGTKYAKDNNTDTRLFC